MSALQSVDSHVLWSLTPSRPLWLLKGHRVGIEDFSSERSESGTAAPFKRTCGYWYDTASCVYDIGLKS
jgi:hypothetical protein